MGERISSNQPNDLEDTREFTPEEIAELGLIIDAENTDSGTEKPDDGGFQHGYDGMYDGRKFMLGDRPWSDVQ